MRIFIYWAFVICLIAGPVTSYAWFIMLAGGGGASPMPNMLFHSNLENSADRAQWIAGTGTPDRDYSSYGLSMGGNYVLRHDAGQDIRVSFTTASKYYVIYRFRYEDAMESTEWVLDLKTTGLSTMCALQHEADGSIRVTDMTLSASYQTYEFVPDVTYWGKLYYIPGTGANGVCGFEYFDGSSWVETTEITNSAQTADITVAKFNNWQDGTGVEYWYRDDVWIFDDDYTGNPNSLVTSNAWQFASIFETAPDRTQWTDTGTVNKDHSSTGLSMTGNYVARFDANSRIKHTLSGNDEPDVYLLFKWRMEDTNENEEIIADVSNTTATVCSLRVETDGDIKVYDGSFSTAITAGLTADTTKWIKFYYNKGTGSDSVCGATYWTGTAWATASENTGGSKTDDIDNVRFLNNQDSAGVEYQYVDNAFLFTTDYTDDPNDLVIPTILKFSSDFETAQDRAQWTENDATVYLDASSSGLDMTGSYVASVTGSGNGFEYNPSSNYSELSVIFQWRHELPMSGVTSAYNWYMVNDGNTDTMCQGWFANTGIITAVGSGFASSGTSAKSEDTTYWVRWYYKKSTGSDGICSISFWDGSDWDDESIQTNSTKNEDVGYLNIINYMNNGQTQYFDEFFIFANQKFAGDPTGL